MRAVRYAFMCGSAWVAPLAAWAQHPPTNAIEVAASLGYALPAGEAERGGRLSDTSFGAVPVALDAAYQFDSRIGVAGHFAYGLGIPTLCHTAGDCTASLGSDVVAALAARFYLPEVGHFAPTADAGIGYEWLTTRLSDSGARSTRAYGGPIVLRIALAAPLRLSRHWSFGPFADVALGTFTAYSLRTNVGSVSGGVDGHAVHGWVSFGGRLAYAF